jgi:hypothetical protein
MTGDAMGALRADREAVLELGAGLTARRGGWDRLGVKACGDERQLGLAAQLKVF